METLLEFGNPCFWVCVVVLLVMTSLLVLWADWNYIFPSFSLSNKYVQFIVRWSLLILLVLCPFVRCDYFFGDLMNPVGRITCVYLAAVGGFYFIACAWFVFWIIFIALMKIIYWACGKHYEIEVTHDY